MDFEDFDVLIGVIHPELHSVFRHHVNFDDAS
jgi:hypothetical protein